jgi:hypothetical protein
MSHESWRVRVIGVYGLMPAKHAPSLEGHCCSRVFAGRSQRGSLRGGIEGAVDGIALWRAVISGPKGGWLASRRLEHLAVGEDDRLSRLFSPRVPFNAGRGTGMAEVNHVLHTFRGRTDKQ